jgi:serine protease Do
VAGRDGEVRVADVDPGSPADDAGVTPGLVISELGGTKLASVRDYLRALKKYKAGDVVELELRTGDGEERRMRVKLAALESRPSP